MTMVSRIMGFARDMLIANLFGVSGATDAFFVAFKIPNFLRRLFAEGAFAHAFIPVLTEYKQHKPQNELRLFIDKTAGTLGGILILLTIAGVIATPLLIVIFAPGFLREGEQYHLAINLLQITFPYLFFITLTAFAGALLNAYGKFAIPAITPALLNISIITAAIWLSPQCAEPIMALAWGVFAAGLVQLAFQIPALLRLGLLPRLRWAWNDNEIKKVIKRMLPSIFGVSVVQVNLLVDTLIASFLISGSVSWLYYSDRLVEFPLGILGVAVATVILPNLSKNHATDDFIAFSKSLDWGLKLVLLIGLPATLGLVLLAEPILSTLFQYNEFGAGDVIMAGKSLTSFAFGLLAFILIKVLVPGFTSRQDIQTPTRIGLYSIIGNILLNLVLVWPMAHAGIALATSLSAYLNAGCLLVILLRQKIYRPGKSWPLFLIRIAFASITMALFLVYFVDKTQWLNWSASERGLNLATAIGSALLIYLASLWLSGIRPRQLIEH